MLVDAYAAYWALTVDELASLTFGALDEASHAAVRDWLLEREHAGRHPELGLSAADVTADTPLPVSVHRLWLDRTADALRYGRPPPPPRGGW